MPDSVIGHLFGAKIGLRFGWDVGLRVDLAQWSPWQGRAIEELETGSAAALVGKGLLASGH